VQRDVIGPREHRGWSGLLVELHSRCGRGVDVARFLNSGANSALAPEHLQTALLRSSAFSVKGKTGESVGTEGEREKRKNRQIMSCLLVACCLLPDVYSWGVVYHNEP
jgi:hypothetical protein